MREEGEPVNRLWEVWWRTLGSVGRKRAGELIKARFVDVMRGRPPSCWLPMTQWSTESPPHPLPQEGASPYAGSRWQWLAEEHQLLFRMIIVKSVQLHTILLEIMDGTIYCDRLLSTVNILPGYCCPTLGYVWQQMWVAVVIGSGQIWQGRVLMILAPGCQNVTAVSPRWVCLPHI